MIPKDPAMLVSWLNMRMRDSGDSLDEVCAVNGLDMEDTLDMLRNAGFVYDAQSGRFR